MAGFDDFLKAIQFGAGVAGGFAAQTQQERQRRQTEQLQLLKILSSQGERFTSVPVSDVERPAGFLNRAFGTGQATQPLSAFPAFPTQPSRGFRPEKPMSPQPPPS